MAGLFLDANIIIDILSRQQSFDLTRLGDNPLYISALTVHLGTYFTKTKIPDKLITHFFQQLRIVPLSEKIIDPSLIGPTSDFEDNVQLNSAQEAKVGYFITQDKALIKMGIFGSVKIISPTDLPNYP